MVTLTNTCVSTESKLIAFCLSNMTTRPILWMHTLRNDEYEMLSQIVHTCVTNYRTPGCTHPMLRGCCRHMTHLNQDGVRVRDIDVTMDYL